MENKQLKIVLVEDNCYDAELMLRALKNNHLANDIIHINDSVKALEFFLRDGNTLNEKILCPI